MLYLIGIILSFISFKYIFNLLICLYLTEQFTSSFYFILVDVSGIRIIRVIFQTRNGNELLGPKVLEEETENANTCDAAPVLPDVQLISIL